MGQGGCQGEGGTHVRVDGELRGGFPILQALCALSLRLESQGGFSFPQNFQMRRTEVQALSPAANRQAPRNPGKGTANASGLGLFLLYSACK